MSLSRKDFFSKKRPRIVVKIGSGIVTTQKGINHSFIKKLSAVLVALKKRGHEVVIVSSGAVACGMSQLKLSHRPDSISKKQAVAAIGQPHLMRYYSEEFQKKGLTASQILLTREDLQTRFANAKNTFNELFALKAIPIVNENDSVAVEEIKFGDNDQLSSLVAHLVNAQLLVILTDTDGLYDKDPKENPKTAQLVSWVEKITPKIIKSASGTKSHKSVGGMITKLKAAQIAEKFGITTAIINGHKPENLLSLLDGKEIGTLFSGKRRHK